VVLSRLPPVPGDGVALLCVRPGDVSACEREPGAVECVPFPEPVVADVPFEPCPRVTVLPADGVRCEERCDRELAVG
jgi:hypothetical protein